MNINTIQKLKNYGPAVVGCYVLLCIVADARGEIKTTLRALKDILGYGGQSGVERALKVLSLAGAISVESAQNGGTSIKIFTFAPVPETGTAVGDFVPETGTETHEVQKNGFLSDSFSLAVNLINKKKKQRKKSFGFTANLDFILDQDLKAVFAEWVSFKTDLKKPFKTQKGLERQYNQLLNLSGGDASVAKTIVEQSITHEWQGLFALKNNSFSAQQPLPSTDDRAARRAKHAALFEEISGGRR